MCYCQRSLILNEKPVISHSLDKRQNHCFAKFLSTIIAQPIVYIHVLPCNTCPSFGLTIRKAHLDDPTFISNTSHSDSSSCPRPQWHPSLSELPPVPPHGPPNLSNPPFKALLCPSGMPTGRRMVRAPVRLGVCVCVCVCMGGGGWPFTQISVWVTMFKFLSP